MMRKITLFVFLFGFIFIVSSNNKKKLKDNSCSATSIAINPPMGWNSYNCFGGNVTEEEMKQNADYMASNLKEFGWEYVVLDFLWYCDNQSSWEQFENRRPAQHIDKYGRLIPSPVLHPSSVGGKGLKPLGDYIHSKGLKFGLHIMRGIPRQAVETNTPVLGAKVKASEIASLTDTCLWYGGLVGVNMTKQGAQEYYNSLFKLYAEWGVDFIKVDDMAYPYHVDEMEAVKKAILNCGRPMVFSLSPGPAFIGNAKHLRENANMWRISADFWDNWKQLNHQLELCRQWAPFVSEGHWPDADMLPLGQLKVRHETKGGEKHYTYFTRDEQYFMMNLWAIFRSPLMMGGNMPENDEFTLSLLTNKELIRLNQNSKNNKEISFKDGVSIWTAEDKDDPIKYIAFFNINETEVTLPFSVGEMVNKTNFELKNLWKGDAENHSINSQKINVVIPPHGSVIYSIK